MMPVHTVEHLDDLPCCPEFSDLVPGDAGAHELCDRRDPVVFS